MNQKAAAAARRVAPTLAQEGARHWGGRRRTAALLRGRKPHFVWGFHVPAPGPLRGSTPAPLPALCGWEGAVSNYKGGPGGAAGRASPCRSWAPASSLVSGQMISTSAPGHVPLLAARPDQTGSHTAQPAPSLGFRVRPATVHPGFEFDPGYPGPPAPLQPGCGGPRSGPAQPPCGQDSNSTRRRRRGRRAPPSWAARAGRAVKRLRRCFATLRPWWVTARPARALATRRAVRRRLQPS